MKGEIAIRRASPLIATYTMRAGMLAYLPTATGFQRALIVHSNKNVAQALGKAADT